MPFCKTTMKKPPPQKKKKKIPLVRLSGMKMIYNSFIFANFQQNEKKKPNLKQINFWLKLVALKTKPNSWHRAGSPGIPPLSMGMSSNAGNVYTAQYTSGQALYPTNMGRRSKVSDEFVGRFGFSNTKQGAAFSRAWLSLCAAQGHGLRSEYHDRCGNYLNW